MCDGVVLEIHLDDQLLAHNSEKTRHHFKTQFKALK